MHPVRRALVVPAFLMIHAGAALSAGGGAPIEDGTYTCISSVRTLMLTLGEMVVTGNSYLFHPEQGPDTSGTYSYAPGHITWSGDIGSVTNAQIGESDLDQGTATDDFWFKFNLDAEHWFIVNCKV